MSENSAILAWFAVLSRVVDVLFSTEADKGQSHNICEIRKKIFKIRKNISICNVFLEIIVKEFIKSEKLLQILIKLLNPEILFCISQANLQIQELSLNPEKYFANPKKYFVTCYLRQQSASVRVCFRHFAPSKNGGGAGVGYIL